MIYFTIDDFNVMTSVVETSGACPFPPDVKYHMVDMPMDANMAGSLFIKGKKKNKKDEEYQTVEYVVRPPPGPEFWEARDGKWVDARDDENKFKHLKQLRNEQLTLSDWTQTGDSPLSAEKKEAWIAWRKKLRDLPADFPDPDKCQIELDRLITDKPA